MVGISLNNPCSILDSGFVCFVLGIVSGSCSSGVYEFWPRMFYRSGWLRCVVFKCGLGVLDVVRVWWVWYPVWYSVLFWWFELVYRCQVELWRMVYITIVSYTILLSSSPPYSSSPYPFPNLSSSILLLLLIILYSSNPLLFPFPFSISIPFCSPNFSYLSHPLL